MANMLENGKIILADHLSLIASYTDTETGPVLHMEFKDVDNKVIAAVLNLPYMDVKELYRMTRYDIHEITSWMNGDRIPMSKGETVKYLPVSQTTIEDAAFMLGYSVFENCPFIAIKHITEEDADTFLYNFPTNDTWHRNENGCIAQSHQFKLFKDTLTQFVRYGDAWHEKYVFNDPLFDELRGFNSIIRPANDCLA